MQAEKRIRYPPAILPSNDNSLTRNYEVSSRRSIYHIYFIQSGHSADAPLKIGYTSDVPRRIESLQIGNPKELLVFTSFKAGSRARAVEIEKLIHRRAKRYRIRGEWFRPHFKMHVILQDIKEYPDREEMSREELDENERVREALARQ